jgi:hypothetical protein
MDVAHRAVQLRRLLEQRDMRGRLEVTRGARLDAPVAGFAHQHGQPADLEFAAV